MKLWLQNEKTSRRGAFFVLLAGAVREFASQEDGGGCGSELVYSLCFFRNLYFLMNWLLYIKKIIEFCRLVKVVLLRWTLLLVLCRLNAKKCQRMNRFVAMCLAFCLKFSTLFQ